MPSLSCCMCCWAHVTHENPFGYFISQLLLQAFVATNWAILNFLFTVCSLVAFLFVLLLVWFTFNNCTIKTPTTVVVCIAINILLIALKWQPWHHIPAWLLLSIWLFLMNLFFLSFHTLYVLDDLYSHLFDCVFSIFDSWVVCWTWGSGQCLHSFLPRNFGLSGRLVSLAVLQTKPSMSQLMMR